MTGAGVRGRLARVAAASLLLAVVGATTADLGLVAEPASARAEGSAHRASIAFPPQRPTKVLILGDSVMAGAATRYAGLLPGRDVTIDAAVNRTTGQGADVVAQRGSDWDVVVVLLGHNDGGSPGVYQPAANRLLDELAKVPRVYWLTLHEVRPYYVGVNQFLRDQAAHRRNLRIADWNAVANQHPEGLAADGLHLNGTGAGYMAGLVDAQVIQTEDDRTHFIQAIAAIQRARNVARLRQAAAAFRAAAARSTTTTTAVPSTTSGVSLIPPATVNHDPPSTTTTAARSTTTVDPPAKSSSGEDDSGPNLGVRTAGFVILVAIVLGVNSYFRARRRRVRPTALLDDPDPADPT
jgi:lysophospholipase L1-like esterase